jgi:hypothetical protein
VLDVRYRLAVVEAKFSGVVTVPEQVLQLQIDELRRKNMFQELFVRQIAGTWSNIFAPESWIRAVYQQSIAKGPIDMSLVADNTPLLGIIQGK